MLANISNEKTPMKTKNEKPYVTEVIVTRVYSDGTTKNITRRFDRREDLCENHAEVLCELPLAKVTKFDKHYQILLRVPKNGINSRNAMLSKAVAILSNLIFATDETIL